jgi:uncharacterized protein with HEPN domain
MANRALALRLNDILEAIERIRSVISGQTLQEFERRWEQQWLVERGVQIISEASRHLSADLKSRHPEIPWVKVAAIGSVLRHDYERISPDVIWEARHRRLSGLGGGLPRRIGKGIACT